jgi:hypothetical protein
MYGTATVMGEDVVGGWFDMVVTARTHSVDDERG